MARQTPALCFTTYRANQRNLEADFWTVAVRPQTLQNYYHYPLTFIVTVGVVASLVAIRVWNQRGKPVKAFLASCAFLFFMLAGACWGLYPTLLPATTSSSLDITLDRAICGHQTLAVGLVWWLFGMPLAVAYVVFVYVRFRGKPELSH